MSFQWNRLHLLALTIVFLLPGVPAGAAWEYPGAKAEVFALDYFDAESDPEGYASCTDGSGGLLVAAYDESTSPARIRVSRIAGGGAELWGQGGVAVPFIIGSLSKHSPIAIAPDGSGGACVAYVETWPTYELFRFAHFTAAGAFDGSFPVDNPGTIGEYEHLSIKLLPLANSDILLAWTQRSPTAKLHAGRFTLDGSLVWHTDVNLTYSHHDYFATDTRTTWEITSDGYDGALIAWLRRNSGTPEIGAQRIGSDGAVWWGTDGHLLWSGFSHDFHDPVIVGDALGGAFVVMSHLGRITAQHLDLWGNAQWGSGLFLQDSGTPYWALSTDPAICLDGAFGFIVVHGNEDLYAQRVDYWGNILWGTGVAVGHRAGQQSLPAIASDGAQGAVLTWLDEYYGMPGQPWHVLTGMRLNGGGGPVWGPRDLYMAWTVYDPHGPRLAADGAGGALCAFANADLSQGGDDIWALGISAAGGATAAPDLPLTALRLESEGPNPFNPRTSFSYSLPSAGRVRLAIHDLRGARITTLVDGERPAGEWTVEWDGLDSRGAAVPSGVYVVLLDAASGMRATKVTLAR